MKSIIIILLSCIILNGCSNMPPDDSVWGKSTMVVYRAQEVNVVKGKYCYWITDEATGWILYTDTKFALGDKIAIVKEL